MNVETIGATAAVRVRTSFSRGLALAVKTITDPTTGQSETWLLIARDGGGSGLEWVPSYAIVEALPSEHLAKDERAA